MSADWLDTYAKFTERTEPSVQYNEWCGIVAVSVALQRKVWYTHDYGLNFFPNLYVLLVGPSGNRKSTAIHYMRTLLKHAGICYGPDKVTPRRLLSQIAESRFKMSQHYPWTPTTNAPPEHYSTAYIVSELSELFQGWDIPLLMSLLTDLYDCPEGWKYETNTVDNCVYLPNIFLTIIGGITPESLKATFPPKLRNAGLMSRFIYAYANTRRYIEPFGTQSDSLLVLAESLSKGLKRIYAMEGPFQRAEDWEDSFRTWYRAEHKEYNTTGGLLHGWDARRQVHLCKLSMISAASRGESIMRRIDFKRALGWVNDAERFLINSLSLYGANDEYEAFRLVEQTIKVYCTAMKPPRTIRVSVLQRMLLKEIPPSLLPGILRDLKTTKIIEYDVTRGSRGCIGDVELFWIGRGE